MQFYQTIMLLKLLSTVNIVLIYPVITNVSFSFTNTVRSCVFTVKPTFVCAFPSATVVRIQQQCYNLKERIFIEDLLVASRAKALSKYPLDDPIFLQLCLQMEQCHQNTVLTAVSNQKKAHTQQESKSLKSVLSNSCGFYSKTRVYI